ncbi:MAG: ATP-utilizing enzyme [Candidatus Alkanophagales archaeon MCA70_species_1]|nr:ATP-utilizing enzyme [Candidatus Alkanophaga volatiphilum]
MVTADGMTELVRRGSPVDRYPLYSQFLNFGHADPPIKMRRVWLNGVEAYAGIAAVDAYLGATQPSERNPEYGGAHVIEESRLGDGDRKSGEAAECERGRARHWEGACDVESKALSPWASRRRACAPEHGGGSSEAAGDGTQVLVAACCEASLAASTPSGKRRGCPRAAAETALRRRTYGGIGMASISELQNYIERRIRSLGGVRAAVAFSGGVDSFLVAFAARRVADAVTIDSEFVHRRSLKEAKELARKFGIVHKTIKISVLDGEIARNGRERCYLCKRKVFKAIRDAGYSVILDGTNSSDIKEERPGLKALEEFGVISPLAELGLSKDDVRRLVSEIDESVAGKPPESCLATRIPLNERITLERLRRVEKAEEILRTLPEISLVRVRDHFPIARIEVPRDEIPALVSGLSSRSDVLSELKKLYGHITVDLEGYRQV